MYEALHKIFADREGGIVFSCFKLYHFIYLAAFFATLFFLIFYLRKKESAFQMRVINTVITFAFCLYMADFFLMPFAYGYIDVDKLPFHACTSMCIMCFWSRHNSFLGRFRQQFTIIGLISNLIYVVYPMGVESYEIHPLSYRALQTLLFHGVMVIYGVLALIYDDFKLEWKKCYRELVVLIIMAIWAVMGNTLYSGRSGDYSHDFNWFFVKRDPFGALPEPLANYVMPFITVISFFGMSVIVYLIYHGIKKANQKKQ